MELIPGDTLNVQIGFQTIHADGTKFYESNGRFSTTVVAPTTTFTWANDIHPTAAPPSSNPPGPEGVSVLSSGNVLVTDTANNALQTFTPGSATTPSVASAPFATSFTGLGTTFSTPRQAVQVNAGEIDVSDSLNGTVKRIRISDHALLGTLNLPYPPYYWSLPRGIAVSDDQSTVAVADAGLAGPGSGRVNIFSSSRSWPTFVRQIGPLNAVEGVAFDHSGNLWVANSGSKQIIEYNGSGPTVHTVWSGTGALTAVGQPALANPTGIAIDPSGGVWVADYGHNRVVGFTPDGLHVKQVITQASVGSPLNAPVTLTFDTHGDLFVAEVTGDRIVHYVPTTTAASDLKAVHTAPSSVSAKRRGPLKLAGVIQASLDLTPPHPRLSYGPQGSIRVQNATLVGSLKLKLKGSRKALRRVPKAVREVLLSRFRATLSGLRLFYPPGGDQFLATGLLATRASGGSRDYACFRIKPTGRGRSFAQLERVTMVGGTGQLAHLTIAATMTPISTKPLRAPKFLSISVGHNRTARGIRPCASLTSKLP